jgi:hypothetical protein
MSRGVHRRPPIGAREPGNVGGLWCTGPMAFVHGHARDTGWVVAHVRAPVTADEGQLPLVPEPTGPGPGPAAEPGPSAEPEPPAEPAEPAEG